MKIVLTKKEFEDFAIEGLKKKYETLLKPHFTEEIVVDQKYGGDVEIELLPTTNREDS